MVKSKVKKIILGTLLALSLVIICVSGLAGFKNIKTEASYNEPNLSPEEVIEKYYEACNSHNKSKVKSTLTGYLKDGSIEFDKSNNMEITSIKEDLKEKQYYMTYGACPVGEENNIKAYRVTYKKVDKKTNKENGKTQYVICLIKQDDDTGWLISNIGQ